MIALTLGDHLQLNEFLVFVLDFTHFEYAAIDLNLAHLALFYDLLLEGGPARPETGLS